MENETITNTSSATNPYTITQNTVTVDGQTGGYTIQVDGGGLGSGSSYSLLKASGTDYTQKGLYMYNYNGNLVELSPTATSANVNNNVLGLNSVGSGTGANQAALKLVLGMLLSKVMYLVIVGKAFYYCCYYLC